MVPVADLPGWEQGLKGKKAGSRVVIVVPPKLGYREQPAEASWPSHTLVFSVDILGSV